MQPVEFPHTPRLHVAGPVIPAVDVASVVGIVKTLVEHFLVVIMAAAMVFIAARMNPV